MFSQTALLLYHSACLEAEVDKGPGQYEATVSKSFFSVIQPTLHRTRLVAHGSWDVAAGTLSGTKKVSTLPAVLCDDFSRPYLAPPRHSRWAIISRALINMDSISRRMPQWQGLRSGRNLPVLLGIVGFA